MSIGARIDALERATINLISRWWRPILYAEYVVSFGVNLILIPLRTGTVPSLTDAAAYLAGGAALSGIRAWEKQKGVARAGNGEA